MVTTGMTDICPGYIMEESSFVFYLFLSFNSFCVPATFDPLRHGSVSVHKRTKLQISNNLAERSKATIVAEIVSYRSLYGSPRIVQVEFLYCQWWWIWYQFSHMKRCWTDSRNRMSSELVGAKLKIRMNSQISCTDFFEYVWGQNDLLQKDRSAKKYLHTKNKLWVIVNSRIKYVKAVFFVNCFYDWNKQMKDRLNSRFH